MANNFATKIHIDNRRLSALWGTLLCQSPKGRELWPQNDWLVWVNIWHPIVKFGIPLIPLELWKIVSWTHLDRAKYSIHVWKLFRYGASGGTEPTKVNLWPRLSRKLLEPGRWNFTHIYVGPSTLLRYEFFPLGGVRGGRAQRTSLNLGPPYISETARAWKSKFYMYLEGPKFSFQIWKHLR